MSSDLPSARSSPYGINSVQFWGSLFWNSFTSSVKESVAVKKFTKKLNYIKEIHCSCLTFLPTWFLLVL